MIDSGQQFFSNSMMGLEGDIIKRQGFDGKIVVIEVGSYSCPEYLMNLVGMHELQKIYPDVIFVTLVVQEMYIGVRSPLHSTIDDRINMATKMKKQDRRLFILDDLEGTLHSKLSFHSNALVIVNKQGQVFYSHKETVPARIFRILQVLQKGARRISKKKLHSILPLHRQGTIQRAIYLFKRSLLILIHADLKALVKVISSRKKGISGD